MKIYSEKTGELLHIVNRKNQISAIRKDIVDPNEYIQIASMSLHNGQKFRAHKHLVQPPKPEKVTQESWVVIQGKVKAFLYDEDDNLVVEVVLEAGDCSITLKGGHNYEALEDNTIIYEFKIGPYFGQEIDKVFIDD